MFNEKLKKQINHVGATLFHAYLNFELFIYPMKNDKFHTISTNFIFIHLIFLQQLYISVRKLVEPETQKKDKTTLDSIYKTISDKNFNISISASDELIKMLPLTNTEINFQYLTKYMQNIIDDIRNSPQMLEVRIIRHFIVHSLNPKPNNASVTDKKLKELEKNMYTIGVILNILNDAVDPDKRFNIKDVKKLTAKLAKDFWTVLGLGVATLNPNFEEYNQEMNKIWQALTKINKN